MRQLLFILFILFSCNPEICFEEGVSETDEWVTYTSEAGHFKSFPRIFQEDSGEPHAKWEIIFKEGWTCYTLNPTGENHDWMKIVGSTFKSWSSNKDNVMLGARWLPDQEGDLVPNVCEGKLQITFYLNINGIRYDPWSPTTHDYWPVVEVEEDSLIVFYYTTTEEEVSMVIEYEDQEYKKTLAHSGINDYYRTISLWAGGTTRPNIDKVIERRRICW